MSQLAIIACWLLKWKGQARHIHPFRFHCPPPNKFNYLSHSYQVELFLVQSTPHTTILLNSPPSWNIFTCFWDFGFFLMLKLFPLHRDQDPQPSLEPLKHKYMQSQPAHSNRKLTECYRAYSLLWAVAGSLSAARTRLDTLTFTKQDVLYVE